MHTRASTYSLTCFLMASCAVSACDNNDNAAAASLTGPRTAGATVSSVNVEPAIIAAELRPSSACRGEAPFDVRLTVNVRARQELFIGRIDFAFVDLSGRRAVPFAFPGTIAVNNSILLPVSLPTTHPVPFPGPVSMANVFVPAGGSFTAPFRLQFDCGVAARGSLLVSVETTDRDGEVRASRVSARIGG